MFGPFSAIESRCPDYVSSCSDPRHAGPCTCPGIPSIAGDGCGVTLARPSSWIATHLIQKAGIPRKTAQAGAVTLIQRLVGALTKSPGAILNSRTLAPKGCWTGCPESTRCPLCRAWMHECRRRMDAQERPLCCYSPGCTSSVPTARCAAGRRGVSGPACAPVGVERPIYIALPVREPLRGHGPCAEHRLPLHRHVNAATTAVSSSAKPGTCVSHRMFYQICPCRRMTGDRLNLLNPLKCMRSLNSSHSTLRLALCFN